MESKLANKLLSICGSADKMYGYKGDNLITELTEEQRIQVEEELIKHFKFSKIVWMKLPIGLTEDKTITIQASSRKITDLDDPTYENKVGYIYTISFTPKLYDPIDLYQPVKDGCVFAPAIYNPQTFEPKQSITLTWSPEFLVNIDEPVRTYEDDKRMIRDMLEKVLANPEDYRPTGYTGCLLRYAVV